MERVAVNGYQGETTVRIDDLSVQCPYDDVTDVYSVVIEWGANGEAPEFQSLRSFIDGFEGEEISQEELAAKIADGVPFDDVSVTVVGEQYGMDVRVQAQGGGDEILGLADNMKEYLIDANSVRTAGVFSEEAVSIPEGTQIFALDSIRDGLDLLDDEYAEITVHTIPVGDGNEMLIFNPTDDNRVVCVSPRV